MRAPALLGVVLVMVLAACSPGGDAAGLGAPAPTPLPTTSRIPPAAPTAAPAAVPTRSPTAVPDGAAAPSASQPRATTWGPSLADWSRAGDLVAEMTVQQQAGQVIVATYPGLEPPVEMIRELGLGGVILLGDNVPSGPGSADALREITDRLQQANDRPYPLVVAVDQEGGPVARVSPPATELPPGMAHGAADDARLSRAAAAASGAELADLGFTTVYAPVADVTTGPTDPTIGVRSPGSDPETVATVALAQVDGLLDGGVVPVLKHFPGHGSVPVDSHVDLPVQQASRDVLDGRDLVPFAEAVAAGAPAVMVAHIDVKAVDPGVPATLSRPVVSDVLRGELGFDGVVVTDSLGMAAITDRYTTAHSAVAALRAGADVLLMPPDPQVARDGVVEAVQTGMLDAGRLRQAAQRVVALQLHIGGLDAARRGGSGEVLPQPVLGSAGAASAELSAAAVTLVSGPCEGRLVGDAITVVGGTEADRARLSVAAGRAGLAVGSGDRVVLLGSPGTVGSGAVVVALDAPYGLAGSAASTARLALFGRTPGAFDALVDVLTGERRASGTLPVSLAGTAPPSC